MPAKYGAQQWMVVPRPEHDVFGVVFLNDTVGRRLVCNENNNPKVLLPEGYDINGS